MAIPNGVRPDTAQLEPTDSHQGDASDAASNAGSGGWETASDDDQDASEATSAPATAGSVPSAAHASSSKASREAEESVQPPATPSRGPEPTGDAADSASPEKWEDWDLCCSLFDNHKSASMEANLEYMLKNFGFYMPDAEYLSDPAGLLRYLVRQCAVSQAMLAYCRCFSCFCDRVGCMPKQTISFRINAGHASCDLLTATLHRTM